MGNGQGPRHRGRDRGARSPQSEPKVLVLPGDEIPDRGLQPGFGTYRVGRRLFVSIMGYATWRDPFVRVVPFAGRYIPKPNDVIVGVVQDVQKTFYLLDIDASRWAPLHTSGTPWEPGPGELDQYLRIGDAVLVAVENLDPTGKIGVTMKGEGLGKLSGGTLATISPAKIPRVIGKAGSMIHTITRLTGTRVAVGQNGRIWVEGTPDGIHRVRECLRIIEEEGQWPGLTERIEGFLQMTGPTDDTGPRPPGPEPVDRTQPERFDEGAPPPDDDPRAPSASPHIPPDETNEGEGPWEA
ncbi:MAG: exosome complex protein Rrp4 [Thermoplasmata archaeon]|nr:exosome complex protein Rrp4 [Thermoplasmata archaeon]